MTEKLKTSRYFEGLNFKYQKRIGHYTTFQELYDRALEQERIDENEEAFLKRRNFGMGNTSKKPRMESRMTTFIPQKPIAQNFLQRNITPLTDCPKCGKTHRGRNCEGKIICYTCKQLGHMARDCRNKPQSMKFQGQNSGGRQEPQNQIMGYITNPRMNQGQKRGRAIGKVFSISGEELGDFEELRSSESAGELLTGTFNIYCIPAFVLIDSGASHSFISITFQSKIKPSPKSTPFHLSVCLPNGSTILCDRI